MSSISYSLFNDFTSSNIGGALILNGKKLKLNNCFFSLCSTVNSGGAIYTDGTKIDMNDCYFLKCYVSTHSNGKYGNAFINKNSECNIRSVSISQCGIDNVKSGDSAFQLDSMTTDVRYINCSSNYGTEGCSSISAFNLVTGSIVKFLSSYDGHDAIITETWYQPLTYYYCNMIDGINGQSQFWATGEMTFVDCIFIKAHPRLNGATSNIKLLNCYSDVKYAGYTFKDDSDLNYFIIDPVKWKCQILTNNNCSSDYRMKLSLFVFIFFDVV